MYEVFLLLHSMNADQENQGSDGAVEGGEPEG